MCSSKGRQRLLARATRLAVSAHDGQVDRTVATDTFAQVLRRRATSSHVAPPDSSKFPDLYTARQPYAGGKLSARVEGLPQGHVVLQMTLRRSVSLRQDRPRAGDNCE